LNYKIQIQKEYNKKYGKSRLNQIYFLKIYLKITKLIILKD